MVETNAPVLGFADRRVNTEITDDQALPSVTGLNNGGWVVAWQSDELGTSRGIYSQVYKADGTQDGTTRADGTIGDGVLKVNSTDVKDYEQKTNISVADLTGNGWVVVWEHADASVGGQAYNANGSTLGNEFFVQSAEFVATIFPTVTALTDGGWVVTWQGLKTSTIANAMDIYAQMYSGEGNQFGIEIRVNTEVADVQTTPSVTSLTDGGWVVTWQSAGQDDNDDDNIASSTGVYGQAYNADGTTQGGEFRVNSTTADAQNAPTVTGLTNGGWVVTWQSAEQDGSGLGVYSKAYNADGTERAYVVAYDISDAAEAELFAARLFADISLTDSDSATLASAMITLAGAMAGEDILGLGLGALLPTNISANYDSTAGILTLSGNASLADYEAALESVVYSSTIPNNLDANTDRTVTAVVNDGVNNSEAIEIIIDYIL